MLIQAAQVYSATPENEQVEPKVMEVTFSFQADLQAPSVRFRGRKSIQTESAYTYPHEGNGFSIWDDKHSRHENYS